MKLNSTNFYENIADGKVLVKFEASWCGPCKAYSPTFNQFAEQNETIKCFSVDCGDHKDISDDFEIRSIPITILFQNGEEIKRKAGKLSIDELNNFITME
jgi:thioredoxin 1